MPGVRGSGGVGVVSMISPLVVSLTGFPTLSFSAHWRAWVPSPIVALILAALGCSVVVSRPQFTEQPASTAGFPAAAV